MGIYFIFLKFSENDDDKPYLKKVRLHSAITLEKTLTHGVCLVQFSELEYQDQSKVYAFWGSTVVAYSILVNLRFDSQGYEVCIPQFISQTSVEKWQFQIFGMVKN